MDYVDATAYTPSEETDLRDGYFILMSRFPNQQGKFGIFAKLSYQILQVYGSQNPDTPIGYIMKDLNECDPIMSKNDISDVCVKMFDKSALKFVMSNAHTVGFETNEGDIIFQHST